MCFIFVFELVTTGSLAAMMITGGHRFETTTSIYLSLWLRFLKSNCHVKCVFRVSVVVESGPRVFNFELDLQRF